MLGKLVFHLDRWLSRPYVRWVGERGGLVVLYVHHLFLNQAETEQGSLDPQQRLTVEDFRRLFEYYQGHGYMFVGPEDVPGKLRPGRRYVMMTFDDGYFNNVRALPVLEEFRAPALFFIATNHVAENKPFWNDVLYREGRKRGRSTVELQALGEQFKRWPVDRVDQELARMYGARAQQTVGDLDRPMTPAELRDFAKSPWVRLGNHTANHVGLPFHDAAVRRAELDGAQAMLAEWTGQVPDTIGYPYGLWDESVVQSSREVGLRLGFTAVREKVRVPLRRQRLLTLGRFLPSPGPMMDQELAFFRSDLMLSRRLHRIRDRLSGRRLSDDGY